MPQGVFALLGLFAKFLLMRAIGVFFVAASVTVDIEVSDRGAVRRNDEATMPAEGDASRPDRELSALEVGGQRKSGSGAEAALRGDPAQWSRRRRRPPPAAPSGCGRRCGEVDARRRRPRAVGPILP